VPTLDQHLSRTAERRPPAVEAGPAGATLDMPRLSVRQAARAAGVSESLIYAWCAERRLAHYRVGAAGRRGRILIDPADLDAVMRTCRADRHPLLAVEDAAG
jgi:excisionase family DNA binding protein